MIQFNQRQGDHQGQGDVTFLKPSGRTLNVTIGPGLPSSTSELLDALSCNCIFIKQVLLKALKRKTLGEL